MRRRTAPTAPVPVRSERDHLGEGPVWAAATGELWWVDITAGTVHRWNPRSGSESRLELDGEVSAVVPRVGGGLVLAVGHDLVAEDADGARRLLARVEADLGDNRFNDCRCDPRGRLWAGTMSKTRRRGAAALYRLTPEGALTRELAATTVSNGLGWSPDAEQMYFIDSPTQRVDVFDFDAAAGVMGDRRTLVEIDPAAGLPDGMAVDAEGGIWVALFGGGAVRRYTPDGRLDAHIELPVSNPTCPAFGGPDLDTLYITSAQHRLSPAERVRQPLAGALFALRPGVRGLPATEFAG
jgi:sugar lactone lactonase YvrE